MCRYKNSVVITALSLGVWPDLLMCFDMQAIMDPSESLRESGKFHSRQFQNLVIWLASNRMLLVCAMKPPNEGHVGNFGPAILSFVPLFGGSIGKFTLKCVLY